MSGIIHLGCHLSPSKGLLRMAETASDLGADTFQFFARNPRGSKAKELDETDAAAMNRFLTDHAFAPIMVHAPYTLNPCSEKDDVREFAAIALEDDLTRTAKMCVSYYNLHPGSHGSQGVEAGIEKTSTLLQQIIPESFDGFVLLETMAGQGSEIGSSFEQIREIIDRIPHNARIGVCLDTCHVYAAGYDLVNKTDEVLTQFDRIIGLSRLKYIHLNDSRYECGSHKDRHAPIGEGCIGIEGIRRIVRHPLLQSLPFCLETPHEIMEEYKEEIKLVRELAGIE